MKNALLFFVGTVIGLVLGWTFWSPVEPTPSIEVVETLVTSTAPAPASPEQVAVMAQVDLENLSAVEALRVLSFKDKMAAIDRLKLGPTVANMIESLQTAQSMSQEELKLALAELNKRAATGIGDFMAPFYLFSAWVDIDPDSAYAYYQDNQANPIQKHMFSAALFSAWGARDPDGALAAVDAIQNFQEKNGAFGALIGAISTTDPARAYTILSDRPEFQNPWSYQSIFSNWAAKNPGEAWAAISSMPGGQNRSQAIAGYFGSLAQVDRQQAASEAMQLGGDADRKAAMKTVLSGWLREDFDSATGYLETIPDGPARNEILDSLSWEFGNSNPEKAIDWVMANTQGQLQDQMTGNIVRNMAEADPVAAAAFVETLPFGRAYENSLKNVARSWEQKDPQAAIGWLQSLPADDSRDQALNQSLSAFARSRPEEAKAYLQTMEAGSMRDSLTGNIASALVKQDPRLALAWAQSLPDESLQATAEKQSMEQWAKSDPKALYNYLEKNDSLEQMGDLTNTIANNWSQQNPSEAGDWASNIKDEKQRIEAIRAVSKEWLAHDSLEASAWIDTLPAGPTRETGVKELVVTLSKSDPATALDWSSEISSPQEQLAIAEPAYKNLYNTNPTQAQNTLRNSSLKTETINSLLQKYK